MFKMCFMHVLEGISGKMPIGTVSANSVDSDLGCTSRVYFDNVTLTSNKPCQHIY